jgi:hypothetical protein
MICKLTNFDSQTSRIAQLRDLIYLLTDDLREMLQQDDPYARPYVNTVFDQTIEYLKELVRLEEDPVYLEPVFEAAPYWSARIEQLRSEHDSFVDSLSTLAERAATEPVTYRLLAQELERWKHKFLDHNKREADLLLESQFVDIGVGD